MSWAQREGIHHNEGAVGKFSVCVGGGRYVLLSSVRVCVREGEFQGELSGYGEYFTWFDRAGQGGERCKQDDAVNTNGH